MIVLHPVIFVNKEAWVRDSCCRREAGNEGDVVFFHTSMDGGKCFSEKRKPLFKIILLKAKDHQETSKGV